MSAIQPIVGWNNLLVGSTYVINTGTEVAGSELDKAWTFDTLNVAQVEADASGVIQFTATMPATAIPFGSGGFGSVAWGYESSDVLIFGAHRHESGGYRTTGGTVSATLDGTPVISSVLDVWPENASVVFPMSTPLAGSVLVVTITGFTANQIVTLPELYFGPVITFNGIRYGYDSYNEVAHGPTFVSSSGRVYPQLRYRSLELKPTLAAVDSTLWTAVDNFREGAIELRNPFWYAWDYLNKPHECYLMRSKSDSLPIKWTHPNYKEMTLDLVENI